MLLARSTMIMIMIMIMIMREQDRSLTLHYRHSPPVPCPSMLHGVFGRLVPPRSVYGEHMNTETEYHSGSVSRLV